MAQRRAYAADPGDGSGENGVIEQASHNLRRYVCDASEGKQ
jgi:hypothetical protein